MFKWIMKILLEVSLTILKLSVKSQLTYVVLLLVFFAWEPGSVVRRKDAKLNIIATSKCFELMPNSWHKQYCNASIIYRIPKAHTHINDQYLL